MLIQKPKITTTLPNGVLSSVLYDYFIYGVKLKFEKETGVNYGVTIRTLWNLAFIEKIHEKYCKKNESTGLWLDCEDESGLFHDKAYLASHFLRELNGFINGVVRERIIFLTTLARYNDFMLSGFGLPPEFASKIGKSKDKIYYNIYIANTTDFKENTVSDIFGEYFKLMSIERNYVEYVMRLFGIFTNETYKEMSEYIHFDNYKKQKNK